MSFIINILTYFFTPLPEGPYKFTYLFLILAILSLIAGIALRIYLKKQKDDKILKKLFKDLPGKLLIFALIELVYFLVRYERMPYLSMRFLNYAVLAWALYFSIHAVQMYIKIYPVEKKHREDKMKLNKYLPRKHKR